MSSVPPQELPNPFTPMAFFPPELAFQITLATYVLIGSSSVLIWDILMNLSSDWKMITRRKPNLSIAVYFISRFSSLAYLLGITILQTSPVGNCSHSIKRIQSLFPIIISSTSLLFFFRIRAMYLDNHYVVGFFFFMWLTVVAGTLTTVFGISGSHIGTTEYCINSGLAPYVAAASICPTLNDTLVFVATTLRLLRNSHVDTSVKSGVDVIIFGRHLPAFSKALLQDGQAYFLTTISLNLVTVALFFNTSIPVVYRSFIGVPNIVLMNSMACHVYRNVRLGIYMGTPTSNRSTTLTSGGDGRSAPSTIAFRSGLGRSHRLGEPRVRTATVDVELDQFENTSMDHHDTKEIPLDHAFVVESNVV